MILRHFRAVRFEGVLTEGRTKPLILGVSGLEHGPTRSTVVKAIGSPEVYSTRQLAAETMGNAVARRIGVLTPEPCVVAIDEQMARMANASLRNEGFQHTIQAGPSAGCDLIVPTPAPYTVGQSLTPELRAQAVRLYLADMLCQNSDRRMEKVNCALTGGGLFAFDFEMCFVHLFLPIIGQSDHQGWQISRSMVYSRHLFHKVVKEDRPSKDFIVQVISTITESWLGDLLESLPEEWRADGSRIGEAIVEISNHSGEFASEIVRTLN